MWPWATTGVGPRSSQARVCTWGTHMHVHPRRTLKNHVRTSMSAEPLPDIKKNPPKDLNFLMDTSFILKRNNRQMCHPTKYCVCSLNVRMKIPPKTLPPPTLKKIELTPVIHWLAWPRLFRLNKLCVYSTASKIYNFILSLIISVRLTETESKRI